MESDARFELGSFQATAEEEIDETDALPVQVHTIADMNVLLHLDETAVLQAWARHLMMKHKGLDLQALSPKQAVNNFSFATLGVKRRKKPRVQLQM